MSPKFRPNDRWALLWILAHLLKLLLRDYHPLRYSFPRNFRPSKKTKSKSKHHIFLLLLIRIQFALSRFLSLIITASRLISLPADTKTLQFSAFLIITDNPKGLDSYSEISGSRAACAFPELIAACHVLLQHSKPSHPPNGLWESIAYAQLYKNKALHPKNSLLSCIISKKLKS